MFGTISFTKNGQYKVSNDHLFSQEESDRATRRFACRTCRLFKVKCSRNPTACARCCSLSLDCVYDQSTESRSQHASNERPSSNSSSLTTQSKSASASPTPRPSSAQGSGRSSTTETLISNFLDCEEPMESDETFAEFTLESPVFRSVQSTLSIEQQPTNDALEVGFSPSGKDVFSMDLGFDEPNLANHGISQGSLTLQDSDKIVSFQTLHDTHWPQSTSQNDDLGGTINMPSPMSPPLSQPPATECNCLGQLSTALFALNGMLRRSAYDESVPTASRFQEALQSVFKVTARTKGLLDKVMCCSCRCFKKSENRVLLVMILEQLVDLCSTLVAQIELRFKEPSEGISVTVHIGGYVVDSEQEQQMVFFFLISERFRTLTASAVSCRDRFGAVADTAHSQARLSSAIHSLGLLRLKIGSRTNMKCKA